MKQILKLFPTTAFFIIVYTFLELVQSIRW